MSAKTFFASEAPVTLKQNDPQLQRILNDPEYQRLWGEYVKLQSQFTPEYQQQLMAQGTDAIRASVGPMQAADKAIKDRFTALGGLPDNHYIVQGSDGQPRILRKTTTAGQIGRMGRQMALMAGAAFGAPALVGAFAPAATTVAPVAGGVAPAASSLGGISVSAAPLSSLGIGTTSALGAGTGAGAAGLGGGLSASFAPGAASGGFGAGGAGFGAGAGSASTIGAGTGAGISMGPAFTGTALTGVAPAATVAGGSGIGSLLASNAGDYVKTGATLAGSYLSGERGQRVATTALLKKRLEEYNRTQPGRQAMEASFMRRLPTHMQGNFPQNFLNTQPAPYVNANYPQFPNYPY